MFGGADEIRMLEFLHFYFILCTNFYSFILITLTLNKMAFNNLLVYGLQHTYKKEVPNAILQP